MAEDQGRCVNDPDMGSHMQPQFIPILRQQPHVLDKKTFH